MRAVADLPQLAPLESLDLTETGLTPARLGSWPHSRHASRLRTIRLTGNRIGAAGIRALAASDRLAGLTELDLEDAHLDHSRNPTGRAGGVGGGTTPALPAGFPGPWQQRSGRSVRAPAGSVAVCRGVEGPPAGPEPRNDRWCPAPGGVALPARLAGTRPQLLSSASGSCGGAGVGRTLRRRLQEVGSHRRRGGER